MKQLSLRAREYVVKPLGFAVGLLLLLLLGKTLVSFEPSFTSLLGTVIFAYQLYVPLFLLGRDRLQLQYYGIHFHGLSIWFLIRLRRLTNRYLPRLYEQLPRTYGAIFDRLSFKQDLSRVWQLSAIIFPLYWLFYHITMTWIEHQQGHALVFRPTVPAGVAMLFVSQLLLVALPEELFYRGFLQKNLLRYWPNGFVIIGVPLGHAIILCNLFFAAAHFVGEYNVSRLLVFFPGLLFSWLTFRGKSIMGAVVFHALCNVFSAFLAQSYFYL